ncbi:MAG: hypothetical protein WC322_06805 [Candidatus Paceibacterota bacterium]|jgi:hypothetical protein
MKIVLSAITFDPAGTVPISTLPGQTLGDSRRRMNRVATLDGGAVFNDFGFSEADRTIKLAWLPTSAAQEAAIERLLMLYTQLHLSTPKGFFVVAPEVYTPGAAESTLTLLVVSKLA